MNMCMYKSLAWFLLYYRNGVHGYIVLINLHEQENLMKVLLPGRMLPILHFVIHVSSSINTMHEMILQV